GHGLGEKPEVVALNKADALTPEQLKQQTARLARAAKKTPLVVSAATGAGVPVVLRALLKVIDQTRHEERPSVAAKAWPPKGGPLRLGEAPKAHAKHRIGATMVVACRRSAASFPHVPRPLPHRLPPHGDKGRLLAPGRQRRRAIA